jgi:gliding motility-associated protein GldL
MLADARIGTDLIQGLGTGLKSLGDNTSRLADLSNASVATDDYVKNVSKASQSLGNMSSAYEKAAHATDALASSAEDIRSYRDQVSNAGKNLAALNAVYELQLQDSNSHLKQTSKFYEGINELMSNLNSSLEDTKKYKDEVAMLARNLSQLNQVYGNMLNAMTVR